MPPGRLNVKQEELDEMLKEAPGPINFTVFLTMFGEKLKGEERFWGERRMHIIRKKRFGCFNPELLLCRGRPRGDHPQRLQGLWPRGKGNFKERLVSSAICWGERRGVFLAWLLTFCLLSVTDMLTTQADRFSPEEVRSSQPDAVWHFWGFYFPCWMILISSLPTQMEQMFAAFPPDVAGNLDYKNLVYIITHGEEKDQE